MREHALLGARTRVGRGCHKELQNALDGLEQIFPLPGVSPPTVNARLVHEAP
jgi:hypothetical protein